MTFSSKNYKGLSFCILITIWLCIAQAIGSRLLILPCLAFFMLLVAWSAFNNLTIPMLLFFLPWSPLLKLAPGSMTFFTFALILVSVITFVRKGSRLERSQFAISILLLGVTLLSKAIDKYAIDNSYILFMLLLVLFPLLADENKGSYDFYILTVFFSVGIITAALSSQQLLMYPSISRYINVFSINEIVRYSGYYGDPNFYSAHITAALSGVMLLLESTKKRSRVYFLIFIAIVLLYCGFLSASKTFILVMLCVATVWIFNVLFMKGKLSSKVTIFLALLLVCLFILYSSLFSESLDIIMKRFGQANDMNELTTGRSELWVMYLRAIIGDIKKLFLGQGFTNIKLEGWGSHNTLIQMVWQFGIMGLALLCSWFTVFCKKIIVSVQNKHKSFLGILVLLIGVLGMWFSIDLMFFDEFFLMPFYICMGINWLRNEASAEEVDSLQ